MEKFDKSKTYGLSTPPTPDGGVYIQNDILYSHDGEPIRSVAPDAVAAGMSPKKAAVGKSGKGKGRGKKRVAKASATSVGNGPDPISDGKPELGPIDLDQKWFNLQAEVTNRFGKQPADKAEALEMIEAAGLMP